MCSSIFMEVVKALSRNPITSALLGKEDTINTIMFIVKKLSGKKFCPKLKVSLEALMGLSRPSNYKNIDLVNNFMFADIVYRKQYSNGHQ